MIISLLLAVVVLVVVVQAATVYTLYAQHTTISQFTSYMASIVTFFHSKPYHQ